MLLSDAFMLDMGAVRRYEIRKVCFFGSFNVNLAT